MMFELCFWNLQQLIDELAISFFVWQSRILLQAENIMLSDKLKIEKEQNLHLRNQIAQVLQVEQDQKMQIEQKDSSIQMLQVRSRILY